MSQSNPSLAAPGAGLPGGELFLVRNLVFPWMQLRLTKAKSCALFEESGSRILALCKPLTQEQLTKRVLIKRLPGMEDSSRDWSVEMTLEHIQVVTAAALFIIAKLEKGHSIDLPVRTQDVKPSGGLGLDRVRAFEDYLAEVPARLTKENYSNDATHLHPWFGELKSKDWLRLIAFHQNLHRKQIERILAA